MSAFDGVRTMDSQGNMTTPLERRRRSEAARRANERLKKRARQDAQRAREESRQSTADSGSRDQGEDTAIDRGQGDPDQGSDGEGPGGGGSRGRRVKGLAGGAWVARRVTVNYSGDSVIIARYFATFRADPGTTWSLSSHGNGPARWRLESEGLDFDTGAGEKLHGFAIGRDGPHEVVCEHVIIARRSWFHSRGIGNPLFLPWGMGIDFTATLFGGRALALDEIAGTIQREWVYVPDLKAAADNPAGQ